MPTTTTEKPAAKRSTAKRTRKPAAKATDRQDRIEVQRPLWMAVGAVALASDAVQDFLSEALKRGEKIEARARKEIKKRSNGKAKAPAAKAKSKPKARRQAGVGNIADRVLHALEIPTHKDIVTLEKKVDALARKVA